MGLFDSFRKGQPSPEQLELLSHITNAQQKKALLNAIEKGEEIPEYAWTPVATSLDCVEMYKSL